MMKCKKVTEFIAIYNSNQCFQKIFNKIGKPKTFDVTLRDGLQNITDANEIKKHDLSYKKQLYHNIYFNFFPTNMEVGSLVSKKALPILADSMELLKYVEECTEIQTEFKPRHFILIPNLKQMKMAIEYPYANNFSFIASASNSFQKKNAKMTTRETREEIREMLNLLKNNNNKKTKYNVKLYISCINECPIEGKLDIDCIVNEILNYNDVNIDNICLSDTCGSLELEDFEYIVDTCNWFGVPYSKMSLHLHVKNNREHIVKQIIHSALDRKIVNFDVSLLETGGCSVTMDADKIAPNLSYDLYYDSIISYINRKID